MTFPDRFLPQGSGHWWKDMTYYWIKTRHPGILVKYSGRIRNDEC